MKEREPSATARFVAGGVFHCGTHPRLAAEVPPRMAELNEGMLRASSGGRLRSGWGRRAFRAWAGLQQWCSVPGIYLHFVLRKRWIEARAVERLEAGLRQVVILGAGLDTLSLRLGEAYPAATLLEVDHPATQMVKREAVRQRGSKARAPEFVALDLTQRTLRQALESCPSYRPRDPTLFVAEGLLMYLGPSQLTQLLGELRRASGPGSWLLFSFMGEQAPGNFQFQNARPLVDAWLRWQHEAFLWGIAPERLGAFLQEQGLRLQAVAGEEEFRRELLLPEHQGAVLARGERVALAELIP